MNEAELKARKEAWAEWRELPGTTIFRNRVQAELLYLIDKLITHESLVKSHTELQGVIALAVSYREQLDYLDTSDNFLEEVTYDTGTWLSSPSKT
jgi:hypothetical protein